MSVPPQPPRDALRAALESLLGRAVRDVAPAAPDSLGGQAHEGTHGVERISGVAETADGPLPYALVVKRAHPGENPRLARQIRRERWVYAEGPVDGLTPALRPARCHGAHALDDGSSLLFLEDLTTTPRWTTDDFRAAAAALAQFHAAARPRHLEHAEWSDACAFRTFTRVPHLHAAVAQLHADVPPALDSAGVRTILRFWVHQDALFDALASGPRTLSHGDYHDGNVFFVPPRGDARTCVAIDWAYAGPGGLGEDAGTLAGSRFCFRDQTAEEFLALAEAVWSVYSEGLRDAGRARDLDHARCGFVTFAAFDAGLRLLVECAQKEDDAGCARDTAARLDSLAPLLRESERLLHTLHGVGLQ